MKSGENKKKNARAARLEAQLRANLKKRKDQVRARARAAASVTDANVDGSQEPAGD